MGRTKNFADVIHAKMAADPALAEAIEIESFNADVAMKVYDLRKEAGLTQKQLAERIGTHQSVISRIEDADYDGHSLAMLNRIAKALGKKVRIEFYACPSPSAPSVTETFALNWLSAKDWAPTVREGRVLPIGGACAQDAPPLEEPLLASNVFVQGLILGEKKQAGS